jgi:hypothetical protein
MEAARTSETRSTIILHGSTSQKTILNFDICVHASTPRQYRP